MADRVGNGWAPLARRLAAGRAQQKVDCRCSDPQPMSRCVLGAARGVCGDSAQEVDNEVRCQRANW
jgi:hypothetical protein